MKERCRRRRFCDWFRGMLNLGIIAVWGKWMVQMYLVSAHKEEKKKYSGLPPGSVNTGETVQGKKKERKKIE